MFDRMVGQLSTAAATTSTSGTSTTSAQAAAAILKYGGLSANIDRTKEKSAEEKDVQTSEIAVVKARGGHKSLGLDDGRGLKSRPKPRATAIIRKSPALHRVTNLASPFQDVRASVTNS